MVPYAARTWNSCCPSSNSMIEPPSVPDSCTACMTMVESTSSRSRLEFTASPTAPSASSWSTLRTSSALRISRSRTRSTVRMAIAACAANVVSRSTARSSNGSTSVRHSDRTPSTSSSKSIGAPTIVRNPRDPLHVLPPVVRVGEHVGDLLRPAVEPDPPGERAAVGRRRVAGDVVRELVGHARRASQAVDLAVQEVDLRDVGPAQPAGAVDQRVQHDVGIRGGTAEGAEHLARRGQLLPGLLEIETQPSGVQAVRPGSLPAVGHAASLRPHLGRRDPVAAPSWLRRRAAATICCRSQCPPAWRCRQRCAPPRPGQGRPAPSGRLIEAALPGKRRVGRG